MLLPLIGVFTSNYRVFVDMVVLVTTRRLLSTHRTDLKLHDRWFKQLAPELGLTV